MKFLTYTGRIIDYSAPSNADQIHPVDITVGVARTIRYGGQSQRQCSVAEHLAILAAGVLQFGRVILHPATFRGAEQLMPIPIPEGADLPEQSIPWSRIVDGPTLQPDVLDLARVVFLHDAPEAYLADIPYPVKVALGRDKIDAVEDKVLEDIYAHFGLDFALTKKWQVWLEAIDRASAFTEMPAIHDRPIELVRQCLPTNIPWRLHKTLGDEDADERDHLGYRCAPEEALHIYMLVGDVLGLWDKDIVRDQWSSIHFARGRRLGLG